MFYSILFPNSYVCALSVLSSALEAPVTKTNSLCVYTYLGSSF